MGRLGPDPRAFQEWLVKEERLSRKWEKRAAEGHAPAGTCLDLPPWDPSGDVAAGFPGTKKHTMHMSRSASMPAVVADLMSSRAADEASLTCQVLRTRRTERQKRETSVAPGAGESSSVVASSQPWGSSKVGSMYETAQRGAFQGMQRPGDGGTWTELSRTDTPQVPLMYGLTVSAPWAACTGVSINSEHRHMFKRPSRYGAASGGRTEVSFLPPAPGKPRPRRGDAVSQPVIDLMSVDASSWTFFRHSPKSSLAPSRPPTGPR